MKGPDESVSYREGHQNKYFIRIILDSTVTNAFCFEFGVRRVLRPTTKHHIMNSIVALVLSENEGPSRRRYFPPRNLLK